MRERFLFKTKHFVVVDELDNDFALFRRLFEQNISVKMTIKLPNMVKKNRVVSKTTSIRVRFKST
jgi:hypothetical protein